MANYLSTPALSSKIPGESGDFSHRTRWVRHQNEKVKSLPAHPALRVRGSLM